MNGVDASTRIMFHNRIVDGRFWDSRHIGKAAAGGRTPRLNSTATSGRRPQLWTREAVSAGLGHAEAAGEVSVADLQVVLDGEAVLIMREPNRSMAEYRRAYSGW